MKKINNLKAKLLSFAVATLMLLPLVSIANPQLVAADQCGGGGAYKTVKTDIEFGCNGKGDPIADLLFAIVRFISAGVGFVLTASLVWAGILYGSSKDDPQATAKAVKRIKANVIALLLFLFIYAILNFILPGQVLG